MRGMGCVEGQEKEWMGCFLDDLRAFSASTPTSGRLEPRTRGNSGGRRNKGVEHFMVKWITALQRKPGLDYGMQ